MPITLFDYWRSSASYRVRIALHLKGLAFERVPVDLVAGDQNGAAYKARNPQGFVPMLDIDGRSITQSLAIIDYLDATRPEPRLVPEDPVDRAHVLALALIVACDIHPLNNSRVLKYLAQGFGAAEPVRNHWIATWVSDGFAAMEAQAKAQAGTYLYGDTPGLADICLVPQMYNARRFGVPLDAYPLLCEVDACAQQHPAFAAAHPDAVAPASG